MGVIVGFIFISGKNHVVFKKKKKRKPLLRIAISLAAVHCWLHKVLGAVLWVNFPESVWRNCDI